MKRKAYMTAAFWCMMLSSLEEIYWCLGGTCSKNCGKRFLGNNCKFIADYMVSQPRRQQPL